MRKRERERFERRRREFVVELDRFRSLQRSVAATRNPRTKRKRLREMLRQREAVSNARGALATAMQAPARAKLRDIGTRPHRYKNPQRATVRAEQKLDAAIEQADELRTASLPAQQLRAERLLREAFEQGLTLEQAFRDVAASTGLSPGEVFTLGMYLDTELDLVE